MSIAFSYNSGMIYGNLSTMDTEIVPRNNKVVLIPAACL